MTGKVIDSGANSLLLVLLPLALIIMVVFVAWPLIVGIFVIALGWKLWQTYQWQQLSEKIDPLFNQLIQANQGCLTVLDISLKTGLNASTSKWYLDRKTDQYGAVKRLYEDKGVVYYFLTANALGSIFDDSDSDSNTESAPEPNLISTSESDSSDSTTANGESSSVDDTLTKDDNSSKVTEFVTENKNPSDERENISPSPPPENIKSDLGEVIATSDLTFNQADLAKRLEVHSSTIGKRKLDDNFAVWSQTRDPDGIPWQYIEDTKLFIPLG